MKNCDSAMEKNKEIAFGIADRNISFAKETTEQTQLHVEGVAGEACDSNCILKHQTDNKINSVYGLPTMTNDEIVEQVRFGTRKPWCSSQSVDSSKCPPGLVCDLIH